jgi:hypothetical protein
MALTQAERQETLYKYATGLLGQLLDDRPNGSNDATFFNTEWKTDETADLAKILLDFNRTQSPPLGFDPIIAAGLAPAAFVEAVYKNIFAQANPAQSGLDWALGLYNEELAADPAADPLTIESRVVARLFATVDAWPTVNSPDRADLVANNDADFVAAGDKTYAILQNRIALNKSFYEKGGSNYVFPANPANTTNDATYIKALRDAVAAVDDTSASVVKAESDLNTVLATLPDGSNVPPAPPIGDDIIYGDGSTAADHAISGNDNNNTLLFNDAWLADDFKVIDGKGGNDRLEAELREGDTVFNPTVLSVEHVRVKAQQRLEDGEDAANGDNNIVDGAQIDADKFFGVNVWESYKSRADVVIEDIHIFDKPLTDIRNLADPTLKRVTADVTFEFRDSDPGHVDFAAYFNQDSLRKGQGSSSSSIALVWANTTDILNKLDPLTNFPVDGFTFHLDGDQITVTSADIKAATTWTELADAVQDALKLHSDIRVRNLVVTQGRLVDRTDSNDRVIVKVQEIVITGEGHNLTTEVDDGANVSGRFPTVASPVLDVILGSTSNSALITSNIVLDNVGSGSTGGDLLIGGQSDGDTSGSRGVQEFDIRVQRDSRLEVVSSTNNSLEVVNIVSEGANWIHPGYYQNYSGANPEGTPVARAGLLSILGSTRVSPTINTWSQTKLDGAKGYYDWHTDAWGRAVWRSADNNTAADQDLDGGTAAQNNGFGLTDVRIIDASSFLGNLTLNAVLTAAVQDKYLNTRDLGDPAEDNKDHVINRHFEYKLGTETNVFDLSISSSNLQAHGAGTREDLKIDIVGGAKGDTVNTAIHADGAASNGSYGVGNLAAASETTAWFLNEWKNTHEYNRVGQYGDLTYDANKSDSGLFVDTGSGDDTVANFGSGAWDVRLGVGNDTYYSDNTGQRAVWVFNTRDQSTRGAVAARSLDNAGLISDDNNVYTNFRGTLSVTLTLPHYDGGSGVLDDLLRERPDYTSTVNVSLGNADGVVTDLEINQAIKKAINTDPVLSKLLEAVDGPANTLVVRSLIDGKALDAFDPNGINRGGYNGLSVNFHADSGYSASAIVARGDYLSALANGYAGDRSTHTTANRVHIESGNDVVVLSTGAGSQDVLVFDAASYASGSKTTVVHFDPNANKPKAQTPVYDTGNAESFVVSFTDLDLKDVNTHATLAFNGGDGVDLAGYFGGITKPVYKAADVADAFLYQLKNGTVTNGGFVDNSGISAAGVYTADAVGNNDRYVITIYGGAAASNGSITIPGYANPITFNAGDTGNDIAAKFDNITFTYGAGGDTWQASVVGNVVTLITVGGSSGADLTTQEQADFAPEVKHAEFYYYRDSEANVWEVTDAGTGLKFSRIKSVTDNTEKTGVVRYANPDPLTVAAQPTVDTVYKELFVWSELKTSGSPPTYVNPVSLSKIVEGRPDGGEATNAQIVVDYAGSAAAYSYDFTFGDNVAKIHIDKDDGAITIASKVAAAIDAAANWTATRTGTVVTITRDTTGEVADWTAKYQNKGALGDFDDPGIKGEVALTIESGLTGATPTTPKVIGFFGVPVIVTGTTATDVATAIRTALNQLEPAKWPTALEGWEKTVAGTGANIVFKQVAGNASIDPVTAFPDSAISFYSGTLPTGLKSAFEDGSLLFPTAVIADLDSSGNISTNDTFTTTFGINPATAIADKDGYVEYLGEVIQVDAGDTAAAIVAKIVTAVSSYTTGTGAEEVTWTLSQGSGANTHNLIFTADVVGASPNASAAAGQLTTDSTTFTPISGGGTAYKPAQAELDELLDDSIPEWTVDPAFSETNVVANIITSDDKTHNGTDKVGNQIGTIDPVREAFGDGDYLDFSAWDAYKVVEGGSIIASTTDTAGTGKYVSIGGTDGIYTFTLNQDGGGLSQVLGTVDFGEDIDFNTTNFILYNDIIV